MNSKFLKYGLFISAGAFCTAALISGLVAARAAEEPIRFADQGKAWTPALRAAFYVQDQGSQLIPLAWLKALHQPSGAGFTQDALARYGYLPNPSAASADLPVGFSVANSPQGLMVGMTCAACHTRQMKVDSISYRIDGGPAFADFQSFVVDLDAAVERVLTDDAAFSTFAKAVLGADANEPETVRMLHDAVTFWSLRFHTLISRSIPTEKPWGPGRLDAIAMIYNRLNGLDLGEPPTYMLADNMALGDAPARSPFLWNAWREDKTQWGGWAGNGDAGLALARNYGQVIGVFASFHPGPRTGATPLDRDYLSANSANIAGLAAAEAMLTQLAPPVWPFPIDSKLAARGQEVFNRPMAKGGCVECHGPVESEAGPPGNHPWKTETRDVGTDVRQWQVVLRSARSGSLEGATIPGVVEPLKETDLSLNILKTVVTGTLVEIQAAQAQAAAKPSAPRQMMLEAKEASAAKMITHAQMENTMRVPDMLEPADAMTDTQVPPPGSLVYEARVLQGIWAAAPYLHNGSVPSLAELLKPSAQRVKHFKVGPAYDIKTVGLAAEQEGAFILVTTGCEDRASGNSNCGHDYGTQLPADEKAALIEYLKTL